MRKKEVFLNGEHVSPVSIRQPGLHYYLLPWIFRLLEKFEHIKLRICNIYVFLWSLRAWSQALASLPRRSLIAKEMELSADHPMTFDRQHPCCRLDDRTLKKKKSKPKLRERRRLTLKHVKQIFLKLLKNKLWDVMKSVLLADRPHLIP